MIIKGFYDGKLFGFLNHIISGQAEHTLDYYYSMADKLVFRIIIISYLYASIIACFVLLPSTILFKWSSGKKWLDKHTDNIDSLPDLNLGIWIALAAGLGLFMELMVIRIHSSYFQLFAYFKNVSLLSCFLGLGIGYARGSLRPLTTPLVLPFIAFQIIFLYLLRFTDVNALSMNPITEQHAFGIFQSGGVINSSFTYFFLATTFAFNALCFIPLGQLVSRLMMRKNKLAAYSWNLIGSLLGIILFFIISLLWLPPSIWILLSAIAIFPFLYKDQLSFIVSVVSMTIVIIILSVPSRINEYELFSPYQNLTLRIFKSGKMHILASNTFIQTIGSHDPVKEFPYHFKSNPADVLIVGSGTGDDLTAALQNGAQNIDAVEIDPAIQKFGQYLHPDSPYSDPRVNTIIDDARAYIRKTQKKYDLIIYGYLDAHSLLSSKSGGVRLDSYVYTVEAFREARKRLKDNGIIHLSFTTMNPALGQKFYLMLKDAFDGKPPLAYKVGADTHSISGHTFVAGEFVQEPSDLQTDMYINLSKQFKSGEFYADKSTDDWPFLYMPVRKYPTSYLMIVLLLFITSLLYVRNLVPLSVRGFSFPCFFLGAGFMLVETKGITELALYYGSTWFVTSVVITAILIMAFLANLLVYKMGTLPTFKTYGLLFISLLCGFLFTFINTENFPLYASKLLMTVILTFPIFFSGLAFSNELKKSSSLSVAFFSNILGAMLGGFLEYNSMYFGFRSLYIFASIMYGCAFISSLYVWKSTSN